MILICDQGLLGDSIATVNAVQDLASMVGSSGLGPLHLIFRRDDVFELIADKRYIHRLTSLDDLYAVGMPGQVLKVADVTKAFGMQNELSMVQAHYRVLGMTVPKEIEPPRITWNQLDVPAYDYIISPFSRSDHQNNKAWPFDRWQKVIFKLANAGNSVLVIGSTLYDSRQFVECEYDMDTAAEGKGSLDRACSLLHNVKKAVLTIDNGISHLTAGVKAPHIMLYPVCLSPVWVLDPNALIVRGHPPEIQVGQMLDAIKAFAN